MGLPRTHEYRNKEGCIDTVLVQFCVYGVLHSTVLHPERLVVAGHDGSDYPVVLVFPDMGRQKLGMELVATLPGLRV